MICDCSWCDSIDSYVIVYAMAESMSENLVGTKEAAALFGVRPSNFVRDWANREDFPGPVATLARGRLWSHEDLLVYRARTGPRRAVALADLPLSPDATRWLPVIKRRIVRGFRPDRIVLFGSQARGGARLDSDVDLLVVLHNVEHRRRAAARIHAALLGIPLGKDVIVVTPDDVDRLADVAATVIRPALREGRTIYVHR
jgi:predicted nucleotidyltransferase